MGPDLHTLCSKSLHLYTLDLRPIEVSNPGLSKPDPRIFLLTCERLGVRPENCVFLDDDAGYVEGARKVGMRAIHVPSCEEEEVRLVLQRLGEEVGLDLLAAGFPDAPATPAARL